MSCELKSLQKEDNMDKETIVNIVRMGSIVVGVFAALAMIKVAWVPTAILLASGGVWYFSDKV